MQFSDLCLANLCVSQSILTNLDDLKVSEIVNHAVETHCEEILRTSVSF